MASCGPPPQRRPLLVPVKHCCSWLKGTDHLLHHFVEEHAGQLRVQKRLELEWHLERQKGNKHVNKLFVRLLVYLTLPWINFLQKSKHRSTSQLILLWLSSLENKHLSFNGVCGSLESGWESWQCGCSSFRYLLIISLPYLTWPNVIEPLPGWPWGNLSQHWGQTSVISSLTLFTALTAISGTPASTQD